MTVKTGYPVMDGPGGHFSFSDNLLNFTNVLSPRLPEERGDPPFSAWGLLFLFKRESLTVFLHRSIFVGIYWYRPSREPLPGTIDGHYIFTCSLRCRLSPGMYGTKYGPVSGLPRLSLGLESPSFGVRIGRLRSNLFYHYYFSLLSFVYLGKNT